MSKLHIADLQKATQVKNLDRTAQYEIRGGEVCTVTVTISCNDKGVCITSTGPVVCTPY